jgi:hypothetical protein
MLRVPNILRNYEGELRNDGDSVSVTLRDVSCVTEIALHQPVRHQESHLPS